MSPQEDHSDEAALAGEYVLRLLDEEAHQAFEARLTGDPALREHVRAWEEEFSLLAEDIAPVTPPARLKADLHATLFPAAPKATSPLRAWLTGGFVAAGLALGAVFLVPATLDSIAPQPSLVASVAAEDGSLVVAARFIAETNALELVREAGAARQGRVLELWLIAEGADAPVSLGVLSDAVETRVDLPAALAVQLANGVLAISDEPPGGSPTGAPTGDVLAVGPVAGI